MATQTIIASQVVLTEQLYQRKLEQEDKVAICRTWYHDFAGVPDDVFCKAMEKVRLRCEYWPRPANIARAVEEVKAEQPQQSRLALEEFRPRTEEEIAANAARAKRFLQQFKGKTWKVQRAEY